MGINDLHSSDSRIKLEQVSYEQYNRNPLELIKSFIPNTCTTLVEKANPSDRSGKTR